MVLPLLATLTKSLRAAYPIVRRGVKLGLSGNAIQRVLIAANMGVARSPLLKLVKAEREGTANQAQLKFLRFGSMPDVDRLPPALTIITRKLAYTVEMRVLHADTDMQDTIQVTVATDTNMTRKQIEDKAREFLDLAPERYPYIILSTQLIAGIKAGKLGTGG